MQIFLRILKEVGIAIVILILLLVGGFMLFRSQIPFLSSDIPAPVKYAGIDAADFQIVGSYEDETDDTKAYQATNTNLRGLESERKIQTGAPNPFVVTSVEEESDMPTETVTIENSANPVEETVATTETPGDAGVAVNTADTAGTSSLE